MKELPDYLLRKEIYQNSQPTGKTNVAFIDRTIQKVAGLMQLSYHQQDSSKKERFISKLSVRTKLIVFLYVILLASFLKSVQAEMILSGIIVFLHLALSDNSLKNIKRILILTFIFGFLISLPSSLNLVSRGDVIFPLLTLKNDVQFWIYHIPSEIGVTYEGLKLMSLLTLRVFNSVGISFLLVSTTPFNNIIKGLKMFRVPDSLLMVITLTYLYIIILSRSVLESFFALKSRIIGRMENKDVQQLISGRIIHIFKMSKRHFEKTYQAMLARGYSGEVMLIQKDQFSVKDYLILVMLFFFTLLFLIIRNFI